MKHCCRNKGALPWKTNKAKLSCTTANSSRLAPVLAALYCLFHDDIIGRHAVAAFLHAKIPQATAQLSSAFQGRVPRRNVIQRDSHDACQWMATAIHNDVHEIPELQAGDDFSHDFASSGAWGNHPVLIRGAFQKEAQRLQSHPDDSSWPTWDDLMTLASEENDVECRFITHETSKRDSWTLQLGPIDVKRRDGKIHAKDGSLLKPWTIVLNDVDRFHPELSEWMGDTFAMIPQWRRDDGQISLADLGGGIGAHVDDYDVFLIQMAGIRKWEVGKRRISTQEEIQGLIPGLDVRILDFWHADVERGMVDSFTLVPGDVLYLPPRFGHCGTALSDGCMTLSVGLRAPSAKEMIARMSDDIVDAVQGRILDRYTDPQLFQKGCERASNEINQEIKAQGKELIRNAIHEFLDDDDKFDAFFGKLVTESKRSRMDYPVSLQDMSQEGIQELGVWGNVDSAIQAVRSGHGILFAAEGMAWAYSIQDTRRHDDDKGQTSAQVCRLFIDGTMRDIIIEGNDLDTLSLIKRMVDEKRIDSTFFEHVPSISFMELIKDLIQEGYLYGCDD